MTMLSTFFLIECDNRGTEDHLNYQCDCNSNAMLATYNSNDKCHVSMEILEFVIFTGASELLAIMHGIEEKGEYINHIYDTVHPIYNFCLVYFAVNSLIQCNMEEHQEGEVDNELHITNTIFVYDASLSNNDSYSAKTDNYLSAEAMCLDTHMESIIIDVLEIEPFRTNMKGQEPHESSSKDEPIKGDELEKEVTSPSPLAEYYEVFPYNESQGNVLKYIHESLTLLFQLNVVLTIHGA